MMSSILTCDLLDQTKKIYTFIFFTPYKVSQLLFQKSSANYLATRRFSQKYFVDLDFGHR